MIDSKMTANGAGGAYTGILAARAVWIEAQRFKLTPRERGVFGLVNELTTAEGRAEVLVEAGCRPLVSLAWGMPANHIGATLRRLAEMHVLLPLDFGGGRLRLAVNFHFGGWQCTSWRSSEAQWRLYNEARRGAGLTAWLLPPEADLASALPETHRLNWFARFAAASNEDAPESFPNRESARIAAPNLGATGVFFGNQVPDSGTEVPNLGAVPESGTATVGGKNFSSQTKTPMLSRVSRARPDFPETADPRARARPLTVKQLTGTVTGTVQLLNCSEALNGEGRLLRQLEAEFARAHGAAAAKAEMFRSGGFWRRVARTWPQQLADEIGALRAHINEGQNFTRGAWFFVTHYLLKRLNVDNWDQAWAKKPIKNKESLTNP